MKKLILLTVTAVAAFTTPSLLAQMNMDMGGMDMGRDGAHQNAPAPTLPKPAQVVFDNYLKIQTALAQDSVQDLNRNATAIAKSVQTDSAMTLPADVAQQAAALAKAGDLKTAREAFKSLSQSLIQYRDAHKDQVGQFVKVFCSMANASWLQTSTTVNNPYLGQEMVRCGQIQN